MYSKLWESLQGFKYLSGRVFRNHYIHIAYKLKGEKVGVEQQIYEKESERIHTLQYMCPELYCRMNSPESNSLSCCFDVMIILPNLFAPKSPISVHLARDLVTCEGHSI